MQNSMFIRVHKRILNYTTTNTVHNAYIMKFCGEMHGQVFQYKSQNLDFRILALKNTEIKMLADFMILAFQNPEFKTLAFFKIVAF